MTSQDTIKASTRSAGNAGHAQSPQVALPPSRQPAPRPLSPEALIEASEGNSDVPLFGTSPQTTDSALFRLRTPSDSGSPRLRATRLLSNDSHDGIALQRTQTRSSEGSPAPETRRRRRSNTPNDPASPLIADVQMTRSRILISKTHVVYPQPSAMLPFRSAVLGFRAVFHPLSATRIKEAEISIRFLPPMGEPLATPVIKALAPAHLITGNGAKVNKQNEYSGAISLGYDGMANLNLGTSHTVDVSYSAHASIIGSGVETSRAVFSLVENPRAHFSASATIGQSHLRTVSHAGLDPIMDFALLLHLPSRTTSYFEAELNVEANVGRDSISDVARRLLGSPRTYRLVYDGSASLGQLRIAPS